MPEFEGNKIHEEILKLITTLIPSDETEFLSGTIDFFDKIHKYIVNESVGKSLEFFQLGLTTFSEVCLDELIKNSPS
jgi:hypothetical protein